MSYQIVIDNDSLQPFLFELSCLRQKESEMLPRCLLISFKFSFLSLGLAAIQIYRGSHAF